ncbi:MAG: glucose-1-phosphate cytidylyltransferase [Spirochaetota bacterium]
MKAVILAGGLGTRISEESERKPKPMIEIGGKPILWHILKMYSHHGVNEFVICCGYKGYVIKEFFANYFLHTSDVTIDLQNNTVDVHHARGEPWKVTLVDTGENTMTGGRIKRIQKYVDGDFCLTYGDGVSDVNITQLIEAHRASGRKATVTAVKPPGRFGILGCEGDLVTEFVEKPMGDGGFINGGFFVLQPSVFDLIEGDETVWEREPLETLAREKQLGAYFHHGFWQPMDTLRDKKQLEELWQKSQAPWKTWA